MKTELVKKRKAIKRLVIDVNSHIHQEVKFQAVYRNISIRQYVLRAIIEQIKKDKEYQ